MASAIEHRLRIVAKALKDDGFRKDLIDDPKGVLTRETGCELPDNLEIKVIEEAENLAYLVLPHMPSDLLSDEDLDAVAGGGGMTMKAKIGGMDQLPGTGLDPQAIEAMGTHSAMTDSAFCYSAFGGGCTAFGCDDFRR